MKKILTMILVLCFVVNVDVGVCLAPGNSEPFMRLVEEHVDPMYLYARYWLEKKILPMEERPLDATDVKKGFSIIQKYWKKNKELAITSIYMYPDREKDFKNIVLKWEEGHRRLSQKLDEGMKKQLGGFFQRLFDKFKDKLDKELESEDFSQIAERLKYIEDNLEAWWLEGKRLEGRTAKEIAREDFFKLVKEYCSESSKIDRKDIFRILCEFHIKYEFFKEEDCKKECAKFIKYTIDKELSFLKDFSQEDFSLSMKCINGSNLEDKYTCSIKLMAKTEIVKRADKQYLENLVVVIKEFLEKGLIEKCNIPKELFPVVTALKEKQVLNEQFKTLLNPIKQVLVKKIKLKKISNTDLSLIRIVWGFDRAIVKRLQAVNGGITRSKELNKISEGVLTIDNSSLLEKIEIKNKELNSAIEEALGEEIAFNGVGYVSYDVMVEALNKYLKIKIKRKKRGTSKKDLRRLEPGDIINALSEKVSEKVQSIKKSSYQS